MKSLVAEVNIGSQDSCFFYYLQLFIFRNILNKEAKKRIIVYFLIMMVADISLSTF